jgi:cold shock protein
MTGTIKRLVSDKGFGFILGTDKVERFFHRSALQGGTTFESLSEGVAVTFDEERGDKGPRAVNVREA